MTATPHSIIGQMLYARCPSVELTQLVSDLDHALQALITPARRLTWDSPQTAIFDFEGGRIIIAFHEDICDPWQACLTITVGDGDRLVLGRLERRHSTLAHKIVEDIARYHPPDSVRWLTLPKRMESDMLRSLTAELEYAAETQAALGQSKETDRARRLLPPLDSQLVATTDTRLRHALADMRAAQAATEAQFARQEPAPAGSFWGKMRGWVLTKAAPQHPAPALFSQPATLRRM